MNLELAQAAFKANEKAAELASTTSRDFDTQTTLTERQVRNRLAMVRAARRHLNAADRALQGLLEGMRHDY